MNYRFGRHYFAPAAQCLFVSETSARCFAGARHPWLSGLGTLSRDAYHDLTDARRIERDSAKNDSSMDWHGCGCASNQHGGLHGFRGISLVYFDLAYLLLVVISVLHRELAHALLTKSTPERSPTTS